jgi:O-antigen/teichoic acid export membrane protein
MLSALAKMGSAAVVGQFALGLAITAPVFMLTNLQLRGVQATDARSQYEFGHYFTLRLAASGLGIVVVCGIVLAGGYEQTTAAVVLLVAVAKAVESISDVANGLLQKHERLDQVALGLMLKGAISVMAFTAVYGMTHQLTSAVMALVCSWAAVALFYDLRLALRLEGSVRRFFSADWRRIWLLVALSAPLGAVGALSSFDANIPRYVVDHAVGRAGLGIFAALIYLMTVAQMVVNALGQSASTRLGRMFVSREPAAFRRLMWQLALFGILIGVLGFQVAWLFGRKLLSFIYAPEYANFLDVCLVMVVTTSINALSTFMWYGMNAARVLRPQVWIAVATTGTTLVLSSLLIPRLGLKGAALALLISSIIQLCARGAVLRAAVRELE